MRHKRLALSFALGARPPVIRAGPSIWGLVKDRPRAGPETAARILERNTDIMTRRSLHPVLRERIEASALQVF
jgi:hypothetical protein